MWRPDPRLAIQVDLQNIEDTIFELREHYPSLGHPTKRQRGDTARKPSFTFDHWNSAFTIQRMKAKHMNVEDTRTVIVAVIVWRPDPRLAIQVDLQNIEDTIFELREHYPSLGHPTKRQRGDTQRKPSFTFDHWIPKGIKLFAHGDPGLVNDSFSLAFGYPVPATIMSKAVAREVLYPHQIVQRKLQPDDVIDWEVTVTRTVIVAVIVWRPDPRLGIQVDLHCRARRAVSDPPRYCGACGRKLVVQVLPVGWTARCVACGPIP